MKSLYEILPRNKNYLALKFFKLNLKKIASVTRSYAVYILLVIILSKKYFTNFLCDYISYVIVLRH